MRRGIAIGGGAVLAAAAWSHGSAWAAGRAVPRDGRIVAVDGARLHVVELGAGPPVLMIHGLSGQLRNFSYALAGLVASGHRVVLVDRPGYGYSREPGRPGIAAQAASMARLVAALGLERPLVVGHSMGGAVALAMALDHPQAVGGLALIAPLTHPASHVPGWVGVIDRAALRAVWAHVVGVPLTQVIGPRFTRAAFSPDPVPADFAVRGGGLLAARPVSLDQAIGEVAAMSGAMTALVDRYPTLRLPVALLAGRRDAVIAAREQAEIAATLIPGARLELIDGGHMLPVTHPERCAGFIAAAARAVAEHGSIDRAGAAAQTSSTSRP